jgi:hypothetical protein
MVINSGYMAPGVVGHRYDQPLPVVNAPQEPRWTIQDGKLPAGLQLADGRIQGTPTEAAEADLKLKAAAGQQTAQRTVRLIVDPDLPLEIPGQDLDLNVARTTYFYHNFKATGGVGRVTWSVAHGQLPPGLKLVDSGLLMGTPGAKGTFEMTVQAVDQHPAGPRTATRELTIKSGPAPANSIHARRVTEKWQQDGKLDEEFWKLNRVLKDAKGNEVARFDVVWFEDPENRRPAKTRDLILAVRITGTSTDALPLESIHMYLDTRHNREIIYNEDDLHWVAYAATNRQGEKVVGDDVVQGYKGSNAFDQAGVVEDDRPVVMEVEVSRKVFAGHGVHTTFGPNNTYGFELAVGSREDPEKRAYLFSGPKADRDTSVFGNLVIEPAE